MSRSMTVADLMLDLDVFQGPFDLLLALVMREEIELAELPIAEVVVAYVEHVRRRRDRPGVGQRVPRADRRPARDQGAAAVPGRGGRGGAITVEEAEQELIERLIEYRRYAAAARWLTTAPAPTPRVFRAGPAPLAAAPSRRWCRSARIRGAARSHRRGYSPRRRRSTSPWCVASWCRQRIPAGSARSCGERRAFAFDEAVAGLDRLSQAAAFLAVLELYKSGEVDPVQAERVRADPGDPRRGVRSAATRADRPDGASVTHTVEALLFVASEPLSVRELAALTEAPASRVERALDALGDRYGEGRSGVVLERVGGRLGISRVRRQRPRLRPAR